MTIIKYSNIKTLDYGEMLKHKLEHYENQLKNLKIPEDLDKINRFKLKIRSCKEQLSNKAKKIKQFIDNHSIIPQ